MAIKYFLQGFLFGLAYVAPIGLQNLYVINTAISKNKSIVFKTAIITIFFDISLALACFFGIGFILEKFMILKNAIMLLGGICVIYISISLIRTTPDNLDEPKINETILKIILSCFIVTWLNPQAIIDGTLILGGMRASLIKNFSNYFIIGTCLASFIWFSSISIIVSINKTRFNTKILKVINLVCGFVMLIYGLKLCYNVIIQFI
ncbi:LysE/ArgO family amino acid transporter [Clostridium tyrobutyricum]|uniref:LysE/ArgO family amino acid transporter n=1 Tax=Clostridium tyrobutyricum TaxID=1519 RepID=UPI00057E7D08|nr:LysE family transporter [Clostridium tyrobutyricum]MBV4417662.1 LysE family transporter [Clostridium tyrobutyricum]MBV4421689.1 LysE family transporter [Clostridium tyrobutyricum]